MVVTLLIASLSNLSAGKAAAGFLNHPGQTFSSPNPFQYSFSPGFGLNPYGYPHPLSFRHYQVPTPFPEKECTHYSGITVPCHVGGSAVLVEDPVAPKAPHVDNVSTIAKDITADTKSDVDASPTIIEVCSLRLEDLVV